MYYKNIQIASQVPGRSQYEVRAKRSDLKRREKRKMKISQLPQAEANPQVQEVWNEKPDRLRQPQEHPLVRGLERKWRWQAGNQVEAYTHEALIQRALTLASRNDKGAGKAIEAAKAQVVAEVGRPEVAIKR